MKKSIIFLGSLGFALACTMMKPNAYMVSVQQLEKVGNVKDVLYANDLVVGGTYSRYDFQPYLSIDNVLNGPRFGQLKEKIDMKHQKELYADKMTYHAGTWLAGSDAYEKFDTYRYSVWDMGITCNLPYQSSGVSFYRAGDELNTTVEKPDFCSYEASLTNVLMDLNTRCNCYSNDKFNILNVGKSSQREIEEALEMDLLKEHKFLNVYEDDLNCALKESGYYAAQRRAEFKMYIVLSFEIPYRKTMASAYQGWWYREFYDYQKIEDSYVYLGYKVYYEFIRDLNMTAARYIVDQNGLLGLSDMDIQSSVNEILYI